MKLSQKKSVSALYQFQDESCSRHKIYAISVGSIGGNFVMVTMEGEVDSGILCSVIV